MRILVVGSDNKYAIENFYVKHLRELGIDVRHFAAQGLFYEYYERSIVNKIIFRLGLSTIYNRINLQFKKWVMEFQPDVIWIFKGMEIFPSSLVWAKKRNIKLVNYNPDNPFLFSGRGSGNKNVTLSLGLYDLYLTYNLSIKKELERRFSAPVDYLPFGFEISEEIYEDCARQEEILKACFLGNPDKQRAAVIMELAEKGIEMDVYGHNWPAFIKHPNLAAHEPVYETELWRTLRKYRVQLNLMRPHNPDSHNMRSFEVPGIGGIAVMPATPEHVQFFENGREAFFFNSAEECSSIIKKILELPASSADEIRKRARQRSVESGYSYAARTVTALQSIKRLYA